MRRVLPVLLLAAAAQAAEPLFVPAPPVSIGPGSGQVVLADFNGDGRLDMATRHLRQRRVAVWLGDGRGAFTPAPGGAMQLPYEPGSMAVVDANSDRVADLAVTRSDRDAVDVFLGDGRGGFRRAEGSPFPTEGGTLEFHTRGLIAADVNQDGRVDLMTTHGRRNAIGVLLGDGKGGFTAVAPVRTPPGRERYVTTLGDVNGDRHLDVLTAFGSYDDGGPWRLVVQRGDGTGNFEVPGEGYMPIRRGARSIALGRFGGDRAIGVAIGHSDGAITVLLNDGQGNFARSAPVSYFTRGAYALAAVDVTQDGRDDLIAAGGESVSVLVGLSGILIEAPGSPYRAGPGAYRVAVGDIDGDGRPDIAAPSFDGDRVTVLLGRGGLERAGGGLPVILPAAAFAGAR